MLFSQCLTWPCSGDVDDKADWNQALDLTNAAMEDSPPPSYNRSEEHSNFTQQSGGGLFSPTRPLSPGQTANKALPPATGFFRSSRPIGVHPKVAELQSPAFHICRLDRTASFDKGTQASSPAPMKGDRIIQSRSERHIQAQIPTTP